jgi:hypothetical protein
LVFIRFFFQQFAFGGYPTDMDFVSGNGLAGFVIYDFYDLEGPYAYSRSGNSRGAGGEKKN